MSPPPDSARPAPVHPPPPPPPEHPEPGGEVGDKVELEREREGIEQAAGDGAPGGEEPHRAEHERDVEPVVGDDARVIQVQAVGEGGQAGDHGAVLQLECGLTDGAEARHLHQRPQRLEAPDRAARRRLQCGVGVQEGCGIGVVPVVMHVVLVVQPPLPPLLHVVQVGRPVIDKRGLPRDFIRRQTPHGQTHSIQRSARPGINQRRRGCDPSRCPAPPGDGSALCPPPSR